MITEVKSDRIKQIPLPLKLEHQWHKCNNLDCYICRYDLSACIICWGGEGELTSECCGHKLRDDILHEIFMYGLDFQNGGWIYEISR